jgi:hypothetical protein
MYSSQNINKINKFRRIRWETHVPCIRRLEESGQLSGIPLGYELDDQGFTRYNFAFERKIK